MAFKKLLGLDSCPLTEPEIMQRLRDAEEQNLQEVIFSWGQQRVRVKLKYTLPDALMRDNFFYYDAK